MKSDTRRGWQHQGVSGKFLLSNTVRTRTHCHYTTAQPHWTRNHRQHKHIHTHSVVSLSALLDQTAASECSAACLASVAILIILPFHDYAPQTFNLFNREKIHPIIIIKKNVIENLQRCLWVFFLIYTVWSVLYPLSFLLTSNSKWSMLGFMLLSSVCLLFFKRNK